MKVNFVATGYTEDCGISTYTTSLENNLDIDTGRTELKLRSINVLHYVKKAIEAGQSEADIIHIQHEYGIYGPKSIASWLFLPIIWILTRSRDISIVLTLHTAWNKDSIDPPLILIKCVYVQMNNRVIAAIADHLIFLSENAQKKFEESVKYNSSIIIPHGVQTDVREFNHPKRIFGYKDSEPLVVLPGYVRPQKGYDVLLTIASKLSEISFLIAGGVQDESHNKYADKMQHAAPKNVKMSGILSEKQFHGAFAAADLVVLPYDSVTQSGILNWCVAYQIPVIASDRRYFNQFKDDCDGIKIFKSSLEATTLIRSIIENKSKKRKMEQAMSVYRESYSMNTISDNHIELYKKITKNKM